jgi:hypothetical protein
LSTGAFGFGVSVSSAGDVNGDGYEDLICGAANGFPPEASIWYGGPDGPDAVADLVLTGDVTFGISVRGAGDVNGDGYADVIVGDAETGTFVVHHGGPDGLDPEPATVGTGSAGYSISVAGAGDLNGDGYGDVVAGGDDTAGVYYGSATGIAEEPSVMLLGEAGSQFGDSVACLGDTNGDGFDDLGVGAPSAVMVIGFPGSAEGVSEASNVIMTLEEPGEDEPANAGYGFSVGNSVR